MCQLLWLLLLLLFIFLLSSLHFFSSLFRGQWLVCVCVCSEIKFQHRVKNVTNYSVCCVVFCFFMHFKWNNTYFQSVYHVCTWACNIGWCYCCGSLSRSLLLYRVSCLEQHELTRLMITIEYAVRALLTFSIEQKRFAFVFHFLNTFYFFDVSVILCDYYYCVCCVCVARSKKIIYSCSSEQNDYQKILKKSRQLVKRQREKNNTRMQAKQQQQH